MLDEHGQNGPMSVEKSPLVQMTHHLLRGGEELGYKIRDPNPFGPLTEGLFFFFHLKFVAIGILT